MGLGTTGTKAVACFNWTASGKNGQVATATENQAKNLAVDRHSEVGRFTT